MQRLPADSLIDTLASPPQPTGIFNLTDEQWQRAAEAAMQDREGALLVMDTQTGRLRAAVNPRIAFSQAFPPGSTIKPFTALAALRAGLVQRETTRQCSGRYQRGTFSMLCSHPKSETAFNLPHALGYSCNDYFGHLGERLSAGNVAATLATFGFGKRTGANVASESAGQLQPGAWGAAESLGDSAHWLVTPLQLLTAYSALVNGGRLWRPQVDAANGFVAREQSRVPLSPLQRAILLEGMRGAVRYGTAAKAQLDALPFYVMGKTGTSTSSNGFQTQGWFVAFLADNATRDLPAPEELRVGIVVFLKRSHGSTGAEVVRKLLECGMRNAECGMPSEDGAMKRPNHEALNEVAHSALRIPHSALIRVRSITERVTRELAFEDYVTGVVSAEGSTEEELEALKALAVVSRTYAVKNSGRHRADGYDFCSTTHCQRFVWAGKVREQVRRAVRETAGDILRDERGQVGDVYFHAACGGHTANVENLWGVSGRPYLRGVRDSYCATRPNATWTQTIAARDLAKALQRDARTNVGINLTDLAILKRDATGRAETIAVTGAQRKVIRGWEFKMIVGRGLGWQYLKSSRFTVERAGDAFVFTGSGFGHGLGLCQEGSHVMAERGMDYRQQLAFYLPGLSVRQGAGERGSEGVGGRQGDGMNGRRGDGATPMNDEIGQVANLSYLPQQFLFALKGQDSIAVGNAHGTAFKGFDPERVELSSQCDPFRVGNSSLRLRGRCPRLLNQALSGLLIEANLFYPASLIFPAKPHEDFTKADISSEKTSCLLGVASWENFLFLKGEGFTQSKSLTRNDEHFHARYPAGETPLIETAWQTLHTARRRLSSDLSQAGLAWPSRETIEIVVYDSTAAFIQATGRAGWTAAVTTGNKIELQPLSLLQRRGVLAATLQHELTHVVVNALSKENAPRWLSEGLAIRYANEGRALERVRLATPMSVNELEVQLSKPASAAKTRELYARAYREVQTLWQSAGASGVWRRVATIAH